MELFLTVIMLGAVVAIVASPLRGSGDRARRRERSARAGIEAARDAKDGEILDGKLSERDYREVDRQLRAEAGELLGRLDAAHEGGKRR